MRAATVGQARMTQDVDLADAVVAAWKTNNRVTMFLIESLPSCATK